MSNLKKYEKDESVGMQKIVDSMNTLHAKMGGRDKRPERVALESAMAILVKSIERSRHG